MLSPDISFSNKILIAIIICLITSSLFGFNRPEHNCEELGLYLDDVLEEAKFNDVNSHPEIFSNIDRVIELDCSFKAKALTIEGVLYYTTGNILDAKRSYFKAEKLLSDNRNSASYALNQLNLGLIYVLEQNNENALICFERSLDISLELGNEFESADAYLNMGLVKLELDQLDEAEEYFTKANEILKKVDKLPTHGYVYFNLARLHIERKDYSEALNANNNAKSIWEALNDNKGLYFHSRLQSRIYSKLGDIDKEIYHLQKALAYTGDAGIKIAQTNFALGSAFIQKGEPSEAEVYLRSSIQDAQLIDPEDLEFAVAELYDLYTKNNDDQAMKSLLNDVVNTFKLNKDIAKLTENKLLEKDISVDTLNKLNLSLTVARDEIQRKSKSQFLLFSLLGILGLMTLLYITKLNRDKEALITEVQDNNIKLKSSNEELAKYSSTINMQNEMLASRNEDLQNFAYTASHDIKSPLNTIIGYADLLPVLVDKGEDEKVKVFANTIHKSCQRLSNLVTDLLEYAKIDQKKLNVKTIQTTSLFEDLSNSLASELASKEIQLEIDESIPANIEGDYIKLTQLFQNLISNAIKFSKTNTASWIKVWGDQTDENYHKIKVQDNGIGIAENHLDKIFSMFEKLHNDDEYEGTGIGLAVCQKVAFLHQGKLEVESILGAGSTFTLYLPKSISVIRTS